MSCGYGGIFKIDVKDPYNMKIEKKYEGSYIYDTEIDEKYVYVADRDKGIIVLEK